MVKRAEKARMPTSRIRNKREAGFSLVELLAVLAILSLMVGAVVFNLPKPRSETDRLSASMTAQVSRFLDDGAVAGDMRALGFDVDGMALFAHDGHVWSRRADIAWPDAARITLTQGGQRVELADRAVPTLLFEPYGAVPVFTLSLSARDATYQLSIDDRGRLTRTVQ